MRRAVLITLVASAGSTPDVRADYPLQPAAVGEVKIEGGFWGPRIDINASVTLPNNLAFIERTGRMAVFDRAAGVTTESSDDDVAVVDSDVHKILEGAAYILQQRPEAVDVREIKRKVQRVIAAQQENGLLCPRITLANPEQPWENLRKSHVLYSAGHLFEAGVAWQGATGKEDLLGASARFADLVSRGFRPGKRHEVPGHQEIELALVRLYRATGKRAYLDLCKFFLDQRGHLHGNTERTRGWKPRSADYNQDRVPLTETVHAVGHGVRAGYTYAAMADVAAIFDHAGYRKALDQIWDDVVGSKLYLTGSGATAQYYDEGYGDPYHLPNESAYCETCSTIAHVLWSHRMALLHKDAAYADVMERALYNGVLSGISLSGDHYFYKNPLASRGGVEREESWNPACCQSNLVRVIPQVGSMAYATGPDAIYVNLFVAGEADLKLDAGTVRLKVTTDYPAEGGVLLQVEKAPAPPFSIAVRVPGWATEQPVPSALYRFAKPSATRPAISVSGVRRELTTERGYVHLERRWKPGDRIKLDLPMPVRRVLAHERVEANAGRVAIQRGPLVYCVEAVDHGGLRTDALVLADDASFRTGCRPDLPVDVVVVTADAEAAYEPAWGEAPDTRPQSLVAVPYYLWANREAGYMDVWLPRTAEQATPLPAPTAISDASLSASGKAQGSLEALDDGRRGPSSASRLTPRISWPDTTGGTAWLQAEWAEPRELNRSAVYWAVDRRSQVYWGKRIRGVDLAMPQTWRLLYRNGDEWREVAAEEPYTLRLDLPNEVRFAPVTTTALRLEVEFGAAPCAIQEWWAD